MAELMVMDFKQDMYRASEVLNQLLELNDDAGGRGQGGESSFRWCQESAFISRARSELSDFGPRSSNP